MQAHQIDEVKGELAPGTIYVALSSTAAYGQLLAMVDRKEAVFLGERYVDDVTKAVTVEVPGVPVERKPNPSIGIGREFFVTALKDYENWREKWWREAIQNAVDAGSAKIVCVYKQNEDGTHTVSCEDNGGGMSTDVLLNKFLVLGGSTKTSASGTAGGFGKAKELLLLPWISWEVHSKTTIVRGSGIDYAVEEGELLKGTRLTVTMPADQFTYDAPCMAFIEKCNLPSVQFVVNGTSMRAKLAGKTAVRDIPGKAAIYFHKGKGGSSSKMLIRANGLFMFDRYLSDEVNGHVIVELLAPSIEILTANRDGIRDWTLRNEIDNYANELAKDVKSATRDKAKLIRQIFRGTGNFTSAVAVEREAEILDAVGPIEVKGSGEIKETAVEQVMQIVDSYRERDSGSSVGATRPTLSAPSATLVRTFFEDMRGASKFEAAVKQIVWQPDFFVANEVEGVKVPKEFFPETMSPRVTKIASVWTELCRFVLIQLGSSFRFGVGFLFSDDSLAAYTYEQGTHWLLLNPYRDYKNQKGLLRPTADEDLQSMYASAIHEATHLADGIKYHDESFAAALTHNMAKCAKGWRRVKQIERAIPMRGTVEVDEAVHKPSGRGKQKRDLKHTPTDPHLDSLADQLVIAVADSSRLDSMSDTDAVEAIIAGVEDDVSSLHYPTWEAAGKMRDYLQDSAPFREAVMGVVKRAHAMNRRWRGGLPGHALLHRSDHIRRYYRLLLEQAHRRPRRSSDNGGASAVLHGLLPGRRRGALLLREDVPEDARVHDEQLLVRLRDPDVCADGVGRASDRVEPRDAELRLLVGRLHEQPAERVVVRDVDLDPVVADREAAHPAGRRRRVPAVGEAVVVQDRLAVSVGRRRRRAGPAVLRRQGAVRRRRVRPLVREVPDRPGRVVAVRARRDEAHVRRALRRHDPEHLRLVVVGLAVEVVPLEEEPDLSVAVRVERGRVHPERVVQQAELRRRDLPPTVRVLRRRLVAVVAVVHPQERRPAARQRHPRVLHPPDHVVRRDRLAGRCVQHVAQHPRGARRDERDAADGREALQVPAQVLEVELRDEVHALLRARHLNRRHRRAAAEDVAHRRHELVADGVERGAQLAPDEAADRRRGARAIRGARGRGRHRAGCLGDLVPADVVVVVHHLADVDVRPQLVARDRRRAIAPVDLAVREPLEPRDVDPLPRELLQRLLLPARLRVGLQAVRGRVRQDAAGGVGAEVTESADVVERDLVMHGSSAS